MENKSDIQTQTAEISRNRCDSCELAVLCIKSLYKKIQPVVRAVHITQKEKYLIKMKSKISFALIPF